MRDQRIALVVRAIVEARRNPQGRGSHYPVANRSSLVRASEAKTSPYGPLIRPFGPPDQGRAACLDPSFGPPRGRREIPRRLCILKCVTA
jgi:hypothetical protein